MWQSVPEFGTVVLFAVMLTAACTFAAACMAVQGRPRYLHAARLGAYATSSLIGLAILCLAYAFVTHDFRVRYVAHYSDRSMPWWYLLTALWGGQDGSLLWWLFLLGLYTAACVRWLQGRFRELQPYIIATLMVLVVFFCILMTFAANPFSTSVGGGAPRRRRSQSAAPERLHDHPPAGLYTGFVGCSIPFAFCVAASSRADSTTSGWSRAATGCSSLGCSFRSATRSACSGPTRSSAGEGTGRGTRWRTRRFCRGSRPPRTCTPRMIQERRGMLKMWNVSLVLAHVLPHDLRHVPHALGPHRQRPLVSRSRASGCIFVYFIAVIIAACVGAARLPAAAAAQRRRLSSAILSREVAFVANNWGFAEPSRSSSGRDDISAHQRVAPFPAVDRRARPSTTRGFRRQGSSSSRLMGSAPLLGWRKTSPELLRRGFIAPVARCIFVGTVHLSFGPARALVRPSSRLTESTTG